MRRTNCRVSSNWTWRKERPCKQSRKGIKSGRRERGGEGRKKEIKKEQHMRIENEQRCYWKEVDITRVLDTFIISSTHQMSKGQDDNNSLPTGCGKVHILYFLKYSQSKIFALERNLCISKIIHAPKLRGWAVSTKINTPQKLSTAKVNENSLDKLIAQGKFCSRVARLRMRAVCEACPLGTLAFTVFETACKYWSRDIVRSLVRKEKDERSNSSQRLGNHTMTCKWH